MLMIFFILRYDSERDDKPYMQDYAIEPVPADHMLLDVILRLKKQDPMLTIRKSCREGGSAGQTRRTSTGEMEWPASRV